MTDTAWLIALIATCIGGLLLVVLQLPGTWLIAAATVGYGWRGNWLEIGWQTAAAVAAMAVAAEIVELWTGAWLTRRAGASSRATWCGLLGGIAGMLILSIPVPIIGTLIGGVIGCFTGALVGELTIRDDAIGATRAGLAAAVGRVLGTTAKTAAAVAMAGTVIVAAVM